MTPVERELAALASAIEWPETPDVAGAVAVRIADGAPRRVGRRRAALVLAVVVLAAVAAALAVPPARTAILDWFGIGGARIVRVDELPALAPAADPAVLGAPVSLAGAGDRAGFPFAGPPRHEPPPDEIRVVPGARVSYLWREGDRVRLLITQFPGSVGDPALLKKLVGTATRVEQLVVEGHRAVWLEGGPHVVYFVAPDGGIQDDQGRLAGNTLLVDRGGVTLRVEGLLERDDAVDVVRAMRP